ncbi:MAG: hypothetical protein K9N06_03530 [Candidatus Cloacimonetes bacterium]|nr:hypothetical protein [Candidatus Cloacimonadota bacterium]
MRLHLFKKMILEDYFFSVYNDEAIKSDINEAYLGFIVIKPLPNTIFGRTCLVTYESSEKRHYTCNVRYSVNLAGVKLTVESVAFQEQDSIVAACATSALWSVFHVTCRSNNHYLPSPVELTKSALENYPLKNRYFPNYGLNLEQMAQAIRKVNLDPLCIEPQNTAILKKAIYSYLQCGIPILMGIEIRNIIDGGYIGLHAVSILGYSIGQTESEFKSDAIEELYCHDDQVGCFVRMSFKGNDLAITCGWTIGGIEQEAKVTCLLIAQYNKLRIEYSTIYEYIYWLNNLFSKFKWGKLSWDTFIILSNDLKSKLLAENILPFQKKKEIMTTELPKYVWQSTLSINNKKRIRIIFDATGISQDSLILTDIVYDEEFYNILRILFKILKDQFPNFSVILQYLSEHFTDER